MDPSDRPPNFMGATIIDVDIDAANNMNSDLPTWLRDVLDRALSASGIRTKKKTASEDAINSLTELDLSSVNDSNCPICFDPYQAGNEKENKNMKEENTDAEEGVSNMCNNIREQNSAICENLNNIYNINNIQSLEHAQQFNDPSLFFPVDEGAIINSRFPPRNLSTLENARIDQILPGYAEEEKKEQSQDTDKEEEVSHMPVKMPNCDHVFGKSCIIEWLKGNVSCPLCRVEVEALKETDPKVAKRNNIRDNSFYNFNTNQEQVVNHIVNHLTDIFNPFRRPFNPSITPLTDSYMHQDWATPYYTVDGNSPRTLTSRDPNLVLPRRFPFSEGTSHMPFMPLRSRVRDMRRETRRNNASESRRSSNTGSDNNSSETNPSATSQHNGEDQNDQTPTQVSSDTRGSLPASTGRGGPERTVRNRTTNGRSHPYFRAPSVD
ncbi:uncharacterized protein AC631_03259 [Debaryomyces fabryi]|uniref:RING-type domain-containing protein n=1 Tax=Debaryomyces fabryi TaxID=58627 RepID=A0A0V1PXQ8_9ASCO|nr:uncharacterized protein AC631_03259 [Debaryomyces fabryi]KSA01008.1 hypothetical protein AC631_03259 [Debaryomyces fabryi]CUM55378.1 unnamed protein product [Debaryomyces fabryi]